MIEDDPADAAQIVRTLSDAGYGVELAATGAEAMARCRTTAFDAITLDLILPDAPGHDVLTAIRTDGPNAHTPVVVVTVVSERVMKAGFNVHDSLGKPFEQEALLASLRRAHVEPEHAPVILVVDDSPDARKLAERSLKRLGYRAVCVPSADAALAAAKADHPAAIVLDLIMPGPDGVEFLRRYRRTKQGRATPVIVWTAKELTADEREELVSPVQAVVQKGAGPGALLREIATFVPAPSAAEATRSG